MNTVIPMFRVEAGEASNRTANALRRVVDSRRFVLGEEVESFEREFAAYCGVAHGVGVGNGTDAIELALRALGVGVGDRVVLAANAGFYGSTAVRAIGAEPLYADVSEASLTLAAENLEPLLAAGAKALLVTHLYGQLAHIEDILDVAVRYRIPVVEDCAQAHGAMRQGRRAGSFGALGCFSFYPTKNLGALGDGGAVVTADLRLAQRLRALRQYGWTEKYQVSLPGGRNSRLDELHASVLRDRLPRLDAENARRREIARRYSEAFGKLPVVCPASLDEDYVAHLFVLRVAGRDAFRDFLARQGVATEVHYPVPDHGQSAYPGASGVSLPVTEKASDCVVSLPCFPSLSDAECERVIDVVRRYFAQGGDGAC